MREGFVGVVKQAFGSFIQSFDLESERRRVFETDLKELIAPHLPVLVHRREKLLETCGQERWSDELDSFMHKSLWPSLGADLDYAERNRTFVTLILDVAIEREQRRGSPDGDVAVPCVSRFNTSWAG